MKTVLLYCRRIEIRGVSIDPAESVDRITPITKLVNAIGIDFHAHTGHVYWSDVNQDSISRVLRNGSQREKVVTGTS